VKDENLLKSHVHFELGSGKHLPRCAFLTISMCDFFFSVNIVAILRLVRRFMEFNFKVLNFTKATKLDYLGFSRFSPIILTLIRHN
jgi:hypothetical protein